MSRILKQTHASAQRLYDAGFIDVATMREFDALCLPKPKSGVTAAL